VRILFDTNVVIDAAVPSRAHHEEALELLGYVDRGTIYGLVAPASITTCWYTATVQHGVDPRPLFDVLESTFELALMNRSALRTALSTPTDTDFEDQYLAAAGNEAGADIVATRNEQDFEVSPLTPHHPRALARMLR
jgi:predicted nucleic acid-binding protein